ncbi:hypothetical protein RSAG8_01789, partial [Rhizoctonia solani AG-8 WAC10335]
MSRQIEFTHIDNNLDVQRTLVCLDTSESTSPCSRRSLTTAFLSFSSGPGVVPRRIFMCI